MSARVINCTESWETTIKFLEAMQHTGRMLQQKAWLGMTMVLAMVVGFGGVAPNGNTPVMGCGGALPQMEDMEDSPKVTKPPVRMATSKRALSAEISSQGDSIIWNQRNESFGGWPGIQVKNDSDYQKGDVRKGIIRMSMDSIKAAQVTRATFKINLRKLYGTGADTYRLWGLKTEGDCRANVFDQNEPLKGQIAGVNNSKYGVDANHPCVFDGDASKAGAQELARFNVTTSVISTTTDALTKYIHQQAMTTNHSSTNLVFVITRDQTHPGVAIFSSKEDSNSAPPRLSLTYQGDGEKLDPVADTHIQLDKSGPYGSSETLAVKSSSNPDYDRQAFIRFKVNNYQAQRNPGVKLFLTMATEPQNQGWISVWGLKTGAGCQANRFDEYTLKYNQLGVSDSSGDGMVNSHPCLYRGDSGALASHILTSGMKPGYKIKLSSQKLRDYVQEQVRNSDSGNTELVFVVVRTTDSSEITRFASKEHATLTPPQLAFSNIIDGNQTVCGQTCKNCPAKAFSSTCDLQAHIVRTKDGRTLKRIRIETMGTKIFFFGDWKEVNKNGQRSFKTTSDFYLKSSVLDLIPMKVRPGTGTTITCKPYLAVKSELASLPVVDGKDLIDVSVLQSPTFEMGVRLGQHLREDYPTTPFGQCRPYFFVAVDTSIGAAGFSANEKLGAKEVNLMLAIDPNDPSAIFEFGGDPLEDATTSKDENGKPKKDVKTLSGLGIGYSHNGNMSWKSAVAVPKSTSEFDTNITKEIKGHIYGHAIVNVPSGVDLEIDGDIFFNITNFNDAIKRQFNEGIYSRDLSNLGTDTLKNLKMGVNINSLTLDYTLFSMHMGAGSYSIDNQVHRFAGYLGHDEMKSPQIFKSLGSDVGKKLQDFSDKFFSLVNASRKAEVRGIIDTKSKKYHVRLKAEASMSLGVRLSQQATLNVNNINSDIEATIDASLNLKDLTEDVVSGDIGLKGKVNVDGAKATYSLAGNASLTINKVKVASLEVGVSNKKDKVGKVTLAGTLDSDVVDLELKGHASKGSFKMEGTCNVRLKPVLEAAKTLTETVSAVKKGYTCVKENVAECGWRNVTRVVEDTGSCLSSIRCDKYESAVFFDVCVRWTCTVKERYEKCFECSKIVTEKHTFPEVNLVLSATLHDNIDKPMTGTVKLAVGETQVGEKKFDVETQSVCYKVPSAEISLSNGFKVSNRWFCMKLPK